MSYPSVVRVFATTQSPDFDNPWQSLSPSSSTGSGVIIGPGRVLTGAHVVANATFLQVQKGANPDKMVARVEAICHDADLALLSVDDARLMTGVTPRGIGEIPALRDRVSVVGYPVGGEEISITEGVVSRIEVQRYSHSQRRLLAVTVDAAINSGNSGGPVFKDGKIIGVAFQTLSGAENIGELVPASIIRWFLSGVDSGRVPSIPGIGITTQNLENPFLRARLGIAPGESGVLVISVEYGGSAWGVLREGDALLSIAGHPIANNGSIRYLDRIRTSYTVLLGDAYVGDSIDVTVLREGARQTLTLTLQPVVHLVPPKRYDYVPQHFIYGGLVFQSLSRDFLGTWSKWRYRAPPELVNYYFSGVRTLRRNDVVILTQVLADEINVGYQHLHSEAVVSVNGEPTTGLTDFVAQLKAAAGAVELRMSSNGLIVLDADAVREANARILERYRIPLTP
ncbi:MAG: serine protease [Myxococcota bacterium]|nr:serine protease [Myxococcota bacterium]